MFYEHHLVSSQVAITQDFQQIEVKKGKMQSPWNDRQYHKPKKNLYFIKDLRKLAFLSTLALKNCKIQVKQ